MGEASIFGNIYDAVMKLGRTKVCLSRERAVGRGPLSAGTLMKLLCASVHAPVDIDGGGEGE